jgi:hypothetical protein
MQVTGTLEFQIEVRVEISVGGLQQGELEDDFYDAFFTGSFLEMNPEY